MKVKWLDKPQKHDYPAAASYLRLMLDHAAADAAAEQLKKAEMTAFAAKDIFRASGLSLLGVSNSHVEKDSARIARGEKLSPVLLYRNQALGKLILPTVITGSARSTNSMRTP